MSYKKSPFVRILYHIYFCLRYKTILYLEKNEKETMIKLSELILNSYEELKKALSKELLERAYTKSLEKVRKASTGSASAFINATNQNTNFKVRKIMMPRFAKVLNLL